MLRNQPVTMTVSGLMVVGFLVSFFDVVSKTGFSSSLIIGKSWFPGIITYPWIQTSFIGAVLFTAWAFFATQRMEASQGWKTAALTWVSLVLGFGIAGALSVNYFGLSALSGALVPLVALTVLDAARNPKMKVVFMFVLQLEMQWVALLSSLLVFFTTATDSISAAALFLTLYGLTWLVGLGKVQLPQTKKRVSQRGRPIDDDRYFEKVKQREIEREEKERLRALFERSLIEDPDEKR